MILFLGIFTYVYYVCVHICRYYFCFEWLRIKVVIFIIKIKIKIEDKKFSDIIYFEETTPSSPVYFLSSSFSLCRTNFHRKSITIVPPPDDCHRRRPTTQLAISPLSGAVLLFLPHHFWRRRLTSEELFSLSSLQRGHHHHRLHPPLPLATILTTII